MRITAYRSEEEPDRLGRLSTLAAKMQERGVNLDKVNRLHDHKGILSVVWDWIPTAEDIEATREAWKELREPIVWHTLGGPDTRVCRGAGDARYFDEERIVELAFEDPCFDEDRIRELVLDDPYFDRQDIIERGLVEWKFGPGGDLYAESENYFLPESERERAW